MQPTRPSLAAFPKAYMDALCVTGEMSLREWIEMASKLGISGVEFYPGFIDLKDPSGWREVRRVVEDHGLCMPMLCCSPDFTHPNAAFRRQQVDEQRKMID